MFLLVAEKPMNPARLRFAVAGLCCVVPDTPLPATTTSQQDLVTAGQRRINLLWEWTQAVVAVGMTLAYIASQLLRIESPGLANATFLIVGFYFSRTNHAAIGGVGPKPGTEYKGR